MVYKGRLKIKKSIRIIVHSHWVKLLWNKVTLESQSRRSRILQLNPSLMDWNLSWFAIHFCQFCFLCFLCSSVRKMFEKHHLDTSPNARRILLTRSFYFLDSYPLCTTFPPSHRRTEAILELRIQENGGQILIFVRRINRQSDQVLRKLYSLFKFKFYNFPRTLIVWGAPEHSFSIRLKN